ncbi:hypothetical protein G5B46_21195 [Caulobacter sp. 602-2]|uniref:Uncharacterized protein n=1 Tax=Caulobacter sp. 602-2 TaxID=2710887 RepID=A0A6G4R3K0_9CAUL|nr:hypothetical protein [Caulobacter sp. 602-2]NGM52134.1 hypothetical protein [Caulobacter sp. 602-2]
MKTVKTLLASAMLLATPALAHAADGDSRKSVAIFASLIAVFAGVGTVFLAVFAANAKKKK